MSFEIVDLPSAIGLLESLRPSLVITRRLSLAHTDWELSLQVRGAENSCRPGRGLMTLELTEQNWFLALRRCRQVTKGELTQMKPSFDLDDCLLIKRHDLLPSTTVS